MHEFKSIERNSKSNLEKNIKNHKKADDADDANDDVGISKNKN